MRTKKSGIEGKCKCGEGKLDYCQYDFGDGAVEDCRQPCECGVRTLRECVYETQGLDDDCFMDCKDCDRVRSKAMNPLESCHRCGARSVFDDIARVR